ncbi:MAG: carbohydrate ABC transporter permease [Oscillospiraceae bacterium]|nr:carbohydrate ABC transporter permease [Oscillospiraceae bacterium]
MEKGIMNRFLRGCGNILLGIVSFLIPVIGIVRIAKRPRMGIGAKIITSIVFMIFWVYAVSLIYAMGWAFMNSLKGNLEFFEDMMSPPKRWLFSNYIKAFSLIEFDGVNFIAMFINSIWFALGSAILSTLSHAVTGYIFAKYNFFGKRVFFNFVIFTIALPVVGTLPSLYQIVNSLGLNDSPLFLITALGGFGSNFLITYAFFKSMDRTYMEAARIDGASHSSIFWRIMLPQAAPMLFSIGLLSFIGQWNNYETPLLMLSKMPTLATGLYQFSDKMIFAVGDASQTVYFAGILLASLPVVLLVIAFHEKIMENVSTGGIKG